MAYDGMDDAMTNQANKQPGALRRFGLTGAAIVAACLAAGATFLGYGVDANLPWPVTANTTIAAKYCGGTVLAGTGSTGQFTLTLPAVTGFPSDCSVLIKNGDSTNGKILSGFPSDLYAMLWPKQSVGVKIVNGAWQTFYDPGPYNVPPGGVTLYVNANQTQTNGTTAPGNNTLHFASTPAWITPGVLVYDFTASSVIPAGTTVVSTTGTTAVLSTNVLNSGVGNGDYITGDGNDCLTAGTACSLAGACQNRRQFNTGRSGGFNILLANGTYSMTDGNNALCTVVGNSGGSSPALTGIIGNSTSGSPGNTILAVPANLLGVYIKDGGEASIQNIEFTGGNGSTGIQAAGQSSVADISNIFWGAWGTGGVHLSGTSGAYMNLLGSGETLLANFNYHWSFSGNATFDAGAPTTIPSAISWVGGFLQASGNPYISLGSWSITGSGVAGSTGPKANLVGPGYMTTPGNATCNNAFPGNQNCRLSNGFQDSANDPNVLQGTTYAKLPGTIAGYYAYISDGLAANCSDGTCTTWGAAVTGGGGAIGLFVWADGTNWRIVGPTGAPPVSNITTASDALSGNVNLNNTASYFDGPSMAQGTSGTWYVNGTITFQTLAATGVDNIRCKLWDGTTVISTTAGEAFAGDNMFTLSLSGLITSPAGNIKISCRDTTSTSGQLIASSDGATNNSSFVVGLRIK